MLYKLRLVDYGRRKSQDLSSAITEKLKEPLVIITVKS